MTFTKKIILASLYIGGVVGLSQHDVFAANTNTPISTIRPTTSPQPSSSPEVIVSLAQRTAELKKVVEQYKKVGITADQKEIVLKQVSDLKSKILIQIAGQKITQSSVNAVVVPQPLPTQAKPAIVLYSSNAENMCHNFYRNLAMGSNGNEVIALEALLFKAGFGRTISATGVYSGIFTPELEKKVMAYQKSRGISAVGSVGPQTRSSLNASFGCSNVDTIIPVAPQGITIERGSDVTFQWVTNGSFGVKKIVLIPQLLNGQQGQQIVVLNQPASIFPITTNTYQWEMPSDIPTGSYKFQVTVGYSLPSDISSRAFTIYDKKVQVLPTVTPTPSSTARPTVTPTPYVQPTPTVRIAPTPTLTPTVRYQPTPTVTVRVYTVTPSPTPRPSVTSSPYASPSGSPRH